MNYENHVSRMFCYGISKTVFNKIFGVTTENAPSRKKTTTIVDNDMSVIYNIDL